MGMKLLRRDAGFETLGVRLALFRQARMTAALVIPEPQGEGRSHVALASAADDVDAARKELETTGVSVALVPRTHADWNVSTAHFHDPDGSLIEINQRIGAAASPSAESASSCVLVRGASSSARFATRVGHCGPTNPR